VLVGLALGLVVALVVGFALSRRDDSGTNLGDPGPSEIGGAIPTMGDVQGRSLPDQAFATFDGGEKRFAEYEGTPLVVNVWASTCAPCVKEMPTFEAVHQERGDTVAFVGLNNQDRADKADELAAKTGVTYDLLRDPLGDFFVEMELAAMPTTLFVDAKGKVVYSKAGSLDADELSAIIDEKLGA
jgi:cytochrome c biogenesis protein CcmG, thiol:disulfide interchange protein DsbE